MRTARTESRAQHHHDPVRIREEIDTLQQRLHQIGHDGDCAYEKAMIRFFEVELDKRKEWLKSA